MEAMAAPSTSCSLPRRRARTSPSRSSPPVIECCCCNTKQASASHSTTASSASCSSASSSYTGSPEHYSSIASTSTSTFASSTVSSNPTTVASSIEDDYPIAADGKHADEQEDFCTPTKRSPDKRLRARSAAHTTEYPSPPSSKPKHQYGNVIRRIDFEDRAEDQYSSLEQMLVKNGFSRCRVQTPQGQRARPDDSNSSDSSPSSSPDATPRAVRQRSDTQHQPTTSTIASRAIKKRPSLFSMVTSYIYGSSDTSDDEVVFSPSSAEYTRPRATTLATTGQRAKPIDIPSAKSDRVQHAYTAADKADAMTRARRHATRRKANSLSVRCATSCEHDRRLQDSQSSATDESSPLATPDDLLPRATAVKQDNATAAVRALRRQLEKHVSQQDTSQESAYPASLDDIDTVERHRAIAAAQAKDAKVARALDESVSLPGQSRSLDKQDGIVTYLCTPPKPITFVTAVDKPVLRPSGAEAMLRGALRHARSESNLRTSVRPSASTIPVRAIRKRPSIAAIFGYPSAEIVPAPVVPTKHEFTLPSPPTRIAVPQPRLLRKAASMATLRRAASPVLCGDEATFANIDNIPMASSKNPPLASSLFMPPTVTAASNNIDIATATLPIKQTLRAKQSLESFLVKRQEYERAEAHKRQATTEGRRALGRMSSFHRPALPHVAESYYEEAPPHCVSVQVAAQREANERATTASPSWLKSVASVITTSAIAGIKTLISLPEDGERVAEEQGTRVPFSTDAWGRRGYTHYTPASMRAGFDHPVPVPTLRRTRSLEHPHIASAPSLVAGDKRTGRARSLKDKETRRRERRRRMSEATANATFHHRLSSAFPNFTSDYASQSEESGDDEGWKGKKYVSKATGRVLVVPAIVVSEHSDDNDSDEELDSP